MLQQEANPSPSRPISSITELRPASRGIHASVTEAAHAANVAFNELSELSLADRKSLIAAIRHTARDQVRELSRRAVAETGLGRYEDKIQKHLLAIDKTPGVEILESTTLRGDDGICIEDLSPWGVIGVITPCTNPSETLINNAISMIASGNSLVICPHPAARDVSLFTVDLLNRAIAGAGGPRAVLHVLAEPSMDEARALIAHPDVRTLTVTGGPAVVRQAMGSGKNVIAAGPGNPPAVVDETADLDAAARQLIFGASFDNNIVCVDEKQVVCVESVVDELVERMIAQGAYLVSDEELRRLEALVLAEARPGPEESVVNKAWVGKDAACYLEQIGAKTGPDPRLIIARTEQLHPFVWTELLMPILAITTAPDADAAIDLGIQTERNNRHTMVIHSNDVRRITNMSRKSQASIFVANGCGVAGIGANGEGHTSFTIASPTGHGLTTARTFSRRLRTTAVGVLGR
jgi:acyl-CoA reductase-like NAD-dependent aldehyde dehydrogenase